jgi:hypothetical protein
VAGSSGHCNKPSGSIEGVDLLDCVTVSFSVRTLALAVRG